MSQNAKAMARRADSPLEAAHAAAAGSLSERSSMPVLPHLSPGKAKQACTLDADRRLAAALFAAASLSPGTFRLPLITDAAPHWPARRFILGERRRLEARQMAALMRNLGVH